MISLSVRTKYWLISRLLLCRIISVGDKVIIILSVPRVPVSPQGATPVWLCLSEWGWLQFCTVLHVSYMYYDYCMYSHDNIAVCLLSWSSYYVYSIKRHGQARRTYLWGNVLMTLPRGRLHFVCSCMHILRVMNCLVGSWNCCLAHTHIWDEWLFSYN